MKIHTLIVLCSVILLLTCCTAPAAARLAGEAPEGFSEAPAVRLASAFSTPCVAPMDLTGSGEFSISGKIGVSIDGIGTNEASGIVTAKKPSKQATVRKAYLAAATIGFWAQGYDIGDSDIAIDGNGVAFDFTEPSFIMSKNYWADVTSIVKPKMDASPVKSVDFVITETNTCDTDGEILVVIFDDPKQTVESTVILYFGAQDGWGDAFGIYLPEPADTADPNFGIDLSLGISFSAQGKRNDDYNDQISIVTVNGERLTSSAGGEDDGALEDGALLTVGGLGDSTANPADPYEKNRKYSYDDELYSLVPFVHDGDTHILVETVDYGLKDDNIFFAACVIRNSLPGEGIYLTPLKAENPVGSDHTVTALVLDGCSNPIAGAPVRFDVTDGPHAGTFGTVLTNADGCAAFTYTGTIAGTDTIVAVIDVTDLRCCCPPMTSNKVTKTWYESSPVPEFPSMAVPGVLLGVLCAVAAFLRRE
ncbi:MAG: Ig-like domain-containing protein [Methanomicrobiaceae archaeon]|nr:Ig-like domain-containing protein [Methanomicrobiaceae archaeon]